MMSIPALRRARASGLFTQRLPSLATDVIVVKKSLDVLALWFTLGYPIGRIGIDETLDERVDRDADRQAS
ncbi:hypothetical protein GCM10009828_051150 [Actinoplanes couchii]|uniref:Uncharacterized protein n=1 Tax=Actinoplanes couchii TaxID=403638 RepID=A0ABQ3XUD4_9ACTN|nr:hypothetical protein Aco03nite_103910 [Actinoplanes couchii]